MILHPKKFTALFSALYIACLLAFAPTLALAATTDTQTVNLDEMTDSKRLELAKFLLENGQANKAVQAIIYKKFETKQYIIIAQSMLADALFFSGNKDQAIVTLRKLLAVDPSLTMARYKLAQMLFATDDDLAAKHHFQILRSSISSDQAQNVIGQYLSQIDLRKRWFFNVGGNILPQSNLNGGSSKDIYYCEDTASTPKGVESWTNLLAAFGLDCKAGIPIAPSEQAQSGVAISANITGGYRFRLAENASWTIRATGEYTRYPKPTADVITLAMNSGPTIRLNNASKININASASLSISDKKISQKHYAISSTFDHVFSPQVLGSLTATYGSTENLTNNDYTNTVASLNASVQVSIDSSSFVRFMGGVARAKYVEPNLSYWKVNGGLGYYKEFEHGITIYSEADISYKAKAFEAITTYNFNAKLSKRDFNFFGFTPQLIYNYNRADSNISRNDTDAHSLSIGVTRSF
uniref:Surface lipoprotein assembly modifier C-terminal domain-containing protein n=1 Tax=OCS116 cluster bacterium TaxID=2030921 RepID=A0A2A4Z278_9PROT